MVQIFREFVTSGQTDDGDMILLKARDGDGKEDYLYFPTEAALRMSNLILIAKAKADKNAEGGIERTYEDGEPLNIQALHAIAMHFLRSQNPDAFCLSLKTHGEAAYDFLLTRKLAEGLIVLIHKALDDH